MTKLVGRAQEKETLMRAFRSPEPEMVAVIGRRRVGKTFLVREALKGKIDLEFTGVQNTRSKPQIENFHFLVSTFAENDDLPVPKNWHSAFRQLISVLDKQKSRKQKFVLFFDELPWLASKKSTCS